MGAGGVRQMAKGQVLTQQPDSHQALLLRYWCPRASHFSGSQTFHLQIGRVELCLRFSILLFNCTQVWHIVDSSTSVE